MDLERKLVQEFGYLSALCDTKEEVLKEITKIYYFVTDEEQAMAISACEKIISQKALLK